MKFAHDFSDALERGEYPPQWLDSAISYRRLKKCIKKVQQELSALGLDADTLNGLWQTVETHTPCAPNDAPNKLGDQFRYTFRGEPFHFPWPYTD